MSDTTPSAPLSSLLETTLRDDNVWWRGERIFGLPPMRRWEFQPVLSGVRQGMTPVTVVRGPRQIGKTTLLNQVIDALIGEGISPQRIFRVQFDELPELAKLSEPILELSRWYADRILGKSFNQAAHDGEQAFLFFDEIQNLDDWAPQLKHLVDMHPVRVVVTGSSALRIEAGRDSLAGRITTLEMGPLLLREIANLRGFGDLPGMLHDNGLAPLKDMNFWRELRGFGEQLVRFVRAPLKPSRSGARIRRHRRILTSRGRCWRTCSTKPSSSGPFNTICGWDRAARGATSICSKRFSASHAGTQANRQGKRSIWTSCAVR